MQFPQTQRYYDEALSIPLYYGLSTAEQEVVIRRIRELL
jgi:dTDP-4-amino-4,6-dideoxygalactose transaminase